MKINIFPGDLTDISTRRNPLIVSIADCHESFKLALNHDTMPQVQGYLYASLACCFPVVSGQRKVFYVQDLTKTYIHICYDSYDFYISFPGT